MRWYTNTGELVETVENSAGMPRPTTLADAKRLGLLPSVTGIIDSTLFSHGLEKWRRSHLAAAAYYAGRAGLPFLPGQIEEEANKIGTETVRLNTRMHEAIAKQQTDDPQVGDYVDAAWTIIEAKSEPVDRMMAIERPIIGNGYIGTPDLVMASPAILGDLTVGRPIVIDWKLRESIRKGAPKASLYWENGLQLAAYGQLVEAWDGRKPRLISVVFSKTQDPFETFIVYEWDEDETSRLNTSWRHLWNYWKKRTNYSPKGKRSRSASTGSSCTSATKTCSPSESKQPMDTCDTSQADSPKQAKVLPFESKKQQTAK